MAQNGDRTIRELTAAARSYEATVKAAAQRAWQRVSAEQRETLRDHGAAALAAAAATVLSLFACAAIAGPLLFADVVTAAAAWFGGFSVGAAAAATAAIVAWAAAVPLTGAPLGPWAAVLFCLKGVAVAFVADRLSARVRIDDVRLSDLEKGIQRLQSEARKRNKELAELEVSSAEAHAKLRQEADVARRQLTTLQSVTDPALDTLDGTELVRSLLARLGTALGADGVALYYVEGLGGRIVDASSGLQPLGKGRGRQPVPSDCQNGRTALIHNDAGRVADTSLCQWPDDVTSLISVPVVHGGRLQLVVEVANRKGRRSTEWELALILVVAERAAGLLRQDRYAGTGAVA